MRYVVTELRGYLTATPPSHGNPGSSFHVIDTAWNHRLVVTVRTEDYGRGGYARTARARNRAEKIAAKLNAQEAPKITAPTRAPRRTAGPFLPTCPRCGNICGHDSLYCVECGTRLYPAWSGKYGERS